MINLNLIVRGDCRVSPGRIRTALADREIPASRATSAVAMVAVAVLATSIGLVLSSRGGTADAKSQPSAPAPARQAARLRPYAPPVRHPVSQPVSQRAVPASTELATVLKTAPRYSAPGRLGSGAVPARWYERPSVLPVIATRPGWVRVRLAQRPDGSTAWLPPGDVALSSTPDRIVVNLATTRLALYDHGRLGILRPGRRGHRR